MKIKIKYLRLKILTPSKNIKQVMKILNINDKPGHPMLKLPLFECI